MATIDPEKNLMVNYVPKTLSEEDFSKLFSTIGQVASCKLMIHKDTGESKGFGFITYANPLHAGMAIEQFNGHQIEGKTLKVGFANKSNGDSGGSPRVGNTNRIDHNTNVYVAGLPNLVDESQLEKLFSPYGEIQQKKIIDKGVAGRGIAFIRYANKSHAEAAISAMAGKELPGSQGPLTVKLAIPSSDKVNKVLDMSGTALTSNRYNPMAGQPNKQPSIPTIPPEVLRVVASTGMNVPPSSGHASIVSGQVASLYVYGIPPESNATTLYELFSPFGGILNVRPILDLQKEGKPCKGFAFINFRKYEEACLAMVAMNGFVYGGKPLQVSFKQSREGDFSSGFNSPYTAHQQQQQMQGRLQQHLGGNMPYRPYDY